MCINLVVFEGEFKPIRNAVCLKHDKINAKASVCLIYSYLLAPICLMIYFDIRLTT